MIRSIIHYFGWCKKPKDWDYFLRELVNDKRKNSKPKSF